MQVDRKTAEAALRRGHNVVHEGKEYTRGQTLPADAEKFQATRHEDGSFTRAGMEAIIKRGESVMVGTQVIDNVKDLPDAATLAGADVSKHEAVLDGIDEQIAQLQAQRQKAARAAERASQVSRGQDAEAGAPGQARIEPAMTPPEPHRDLPEGVPAHPAAHAHQTEGKGKGQDFGPTTKKK